MIQQYRSMYLRADDLSTVLKYYAWAAAAGGDGQLSWTGRGNKSQQWQKNLTLEQILTELLLRDGGFIFYLVWEVLEKKVNWLVFWLM